MHVVSLHRHWPGKITTINCNPGATISIRRLAISTVPEVKMQLTPPHLTTVVALADAT